MRTCEQYRDWIPASIDRRLDAAETGELAAHLAGCPDCRRAHEDIEAGDTLLRRRERIELPTGFADSVIAAAKSEPRPRRSWLAPVVPCAIAAGMLVVLGLALTLPGGPTSAAKRELAEHMEKMSTVSQTAASLPGADPSREAALVQNIIDTFELHRPAMALEELARHERSVQEYLVASGEMMRLASEGDVLRLRTLGRDQVIEKAARNVQVKLRLETVEMRDIALTVEVAQPEYRYAVKGRVLLLQGDMNGAKQALQYAVDLTPTHLWMGEAEAGAGNFEEALIHWHRAAADAPQDPWMQEHVMKQVRDSAARHAAFVNFRVEGPLVSIYADTEEVVVAGPESDAQVRSLLMLDNIRASRRFGIAYAAFERARLAEMKLPADAQWLRRAVPAPRK